MTLQTCGPENFRSCRWVPSRGVSVCRTGTRTLGYKVLTVQHWTFQRICVIHSKWQINGNGIIMRTEICYAKNCGHFVLFSRSKAIPHIMFESSWLNIMYIDDYVNTIIDLPSYQNKVSLYISCDLKWTKCMRIYILDQNRRRRKKKLVQFRKSWQDRLSGHSAKLRKFFPKISETKQVRILFLCCVDQLLQKHISKRKDTDYNNCTYDIPVSCKEVLIICIKLSR